VKVKHNKKRNTAFLYEVLVKELTDAIIDKDARRKNFVSSLIKEAFGPSTVLGKELEHYRALVETTNLELYLAEKLLQETKMAHSLLDSKNVFDTQTKIINKINKALSKDAWNTFVPNFKSLATVAAIFNINTPVKQRILHEDTLVKMMNSPEKLEENKLEPIDNIVYHSFVKKFNEQYVELLKEQKDLLSKYIASFADNGLELKLYLNEEIGRLKKVVKASLQLEEVRADENMTEKTKKVLNILESFKNATPTQKNISKVLNIQELVKEINS
jgi:hypothetical protein